MKKLSRRASQLLARVEEGKFYKLHDPKTPKAMQELIDAGLVGLAGRVELVVVCYVPVKGYKPFKMEEYSLVP